MESHFQTESTGNKSCVVVSVVTLYFLVVVNNFYGELEQKIPFGSYVENPYLFFNKYNNAQHGAPAVRRFQP